MKYIMSDIHGEYQMFLKMLEQIDFSDNDTLYILGDVVDRGPEPIKILQYIINKPNIVLLRGNHEEMMLDALALQNNKEFVSTINSRLWMRNGGFVTVDQFLELPFDEQKRIYKYVKDTKLFEIVENNLLVHAGIPMTLKTFEDDDELIKFLKHVSKDDLLWDRDMVENEDYYLDYYYIYCGHTPTLHLHNSNKIYKTKGFAVIDGGACFEPGILICVCLDNNKVYYQTKIT